MSEDKNYDVPEKLAEHAHINLKRYCEMYERSISDSDSFWAEQAEEFLTWSSKWSKVQDWDYNEANINWFVGGKLNVSYNCIDRHLQLRGDQIAIIWEGDDPDEDRQFTYKELHEQVCRFGNVLKAQGVKKGDRVCLYLPMIPEASIAMLACARIGAVHSVVFGGFSSDALRDRINDADCKVVITSDYSLRGKKQIPLKANTDKGLIDCPNVNTCIVVKRSGGDIDWNEDRDIWYHEAIETVSANCPPEEMDAEDPLFILYTSGSTGKPKGVVHTTGGYLLYVAMTHKYVFDYQEREVYWCTADVGWVTGHSYVVYGPLANGATSVMFEGLPNFPDASRFWQIVDKWKVNTFYTAPTSIRMLMGQGDGFVTKTKRTSLRILGTVGEPINPEAWEWYYNIIGRGQCPIVDTWWQTETGGHLITPFPGATQLKPGSATLPFFGIQPCIVDAQGNELEGAAEGALCIKRSWPGQMRTLYGNHDRFKEAYFSMFPDKYFTGDGARRDDDGYYWITGRIDDVINVSGHRMGTAEVESALVSHVDVSEAAVVGFPHDMKGQGIYAYVTLMIGIELTEVLRKDLINHVRKEIGPIASPDLIQWAPRLPKTRSGKIMRRILRKVAAGELSMLGDISTLAEPTVVNDLIENRLNK